MTIPFITKHKQKKAAKAFPYAYAMTPYTETPDIAPPIVKTNQTTLAALYWPAAIRKELEQTHFYTSPATSIFGVTLENGQRYYVQVWPDENVKAAG